MVQKKVVRVGWNGIRIGRDIGMNQILINTGIDFGVTIYNILTVHPYEVALSILAVKLGFSNKILLGIILAFLI